MSDAALRILIVEDERMIARQVEAVSTGAGHIVVGIAATANQAREFLIATKVDLAVVDVNLADQSSGLDVANFIAGRFQTHVLFVTASRRALPDDLCGAIGVMEKPFTAKGLAAVLGYVADRIVGKLLSATQPPGLRLSYTYAARWAA